MSKLFTAGLGTYTLQSSISSTQSTITLTSFKVPVSLDDVTMALLNSDVVYGTIAPRTTNSEFISFTGITQNANGTATLTGVTRGLNKTSPLTTSATFKLPHAGATQFIISDAPGLLNNFSVLSNDETMTGRKQFPTGGTASSAVVGATYAAPVQDNEIATKKYIDDIAIAGAPDATVAVKGIVLMSVAPAVAASPTATGTNDPRVPTQNENDALVGNNTQIAVGTGNKFVTQTGLQQNTEKFASDAGSTDAYAITLSPVPTALSTGMTVGFFANTANTGAATLNVNGLGAKTIVKGVSTTLSDGDIATSQLVGVVYNGTNFVLQTPVKTNSPLTPGAKTVVTSYDLSTASGTVNLAHGCPTTPYLVELSYSMDSSQGTPWISFGTGAYDGTTNSTQYTIISELGVFQSATSTTGIAVNFTANNVGSKQEAVITLTSTNIVFTWTKTSTPTGTGFIKCTAYYAS